MGRGAEITPPRISEQGLRRSGTRELRGELSGFDELLEPRDTVPDGIEPFEASEDWAEPAGDTIPAPMSADAELTSVPKAPPVPNFSDLNQEFAATATGQRVLGNVLPTQPRGKG